MSNALIDGIIGALLGALVAGLGVYLTYQSMRVAARDDATEATLELDRLFVQYPQYRRYISARAELPEEPEDHRERALAVVELAADTLEAILDKVGERRLFSVYSAEDRASWHRYVADTLKNSPEIENFIRGNPSWYPSILERHPELKAGQKAGEKKANDDDTAAG